MPTYSYNSTDSANTRQCVCSNPDRHNAALTLRPDTLHLLPNVLELARAALYLCLRRYFPHDEISFHASNSWRSNSRVSLVEYRGNVIMDTFVAPTTTVVDYRTAATGIEARHFVGPLCSSCLLVTRN